MPGRPTDLPDFSRPPVVEVSLDIQFERLHRFRASHLGLFWQSIKDEFPIVEEYPPVPRTVEQLDDGGPSAGYSLTLEPQPSVPMAWFINEDGDRLVQL